MIAEQEQTHACIENNLTQVKPTVPSVPTCAVYGPKGQAGRVFGLVLEIKGFGYTPIKRDIQGSEADPDYAVFLFPEGKTQKDKTAIMLAATATGRSKTRVLMALALHQNGRFRPLTSTEQQAIMASVTPEDWTLYQQGIGKAKATARSEQPECTDTGECPSQ